MRSDRERERERTGSNTADIDLVIRKMILDFDGSQHIPQQYVTPFASSSNIQNLLNFF